MAVTILRKTPLIAIVAVLIVLLALLVRASMKNASLDTKFRQEMSSRFDVEQKVLSLEKERAGLYARINSLIARLKADEASIKDLKAFLTLTEQENKELKNALSQLRENIVAQSATAATGAM